MLPPLIACACVPDPTTVPAGEYLIVHAVLVAGADSARVLVVRSDEQSLDPSLLEPVTNARVRIVHANDTTTLTSSVACLRTSMQPGQSATTAGCYSAALPGGVRTDEQYELLVDAPGHPSVRGSTRVPAAPAVAQPVPHSELGYRPQVGRDSAEYITARWSISRAGELVDLRFVSMTSSCLIPVGQPHFGAGLDRIMIRGTDSVTVAPIDVRCDGIAAGDRHAAALSVTSYDAHYSAYLRPRTTNTQGIPFTDAAIGITGGFGAFGSAASTLVPVTLVRK